MKSPKTHQQQLGKQGEDIAASFLQTKGYQILQKNFKARYGEIDIVCLHDKTVIFVEVKTRVGLSFGRPEEAVTPRKLQEVIKTAQYYTLLHPQLPKQQRIDVIAVLFNNNETLEQVKHIPNVTG